MTSQNSAIKPQTSGYSRRAFLRASAILGGGLFVGLYLPKGVAAATDSTDSWILNAYIRIGSDDSIRIMAVAPEIGQGIKTSLPMVIADELDVAWEQVQVEQAPVMPEIYGRQSAGGSRSTPIHFEEHRRIGAATRQMLILAAAAQWQVPAAECHSQQGKILHVSGRSLRYGELAAAAAKQAAPELTSVALKTDAQLQIVGKFTAGVDNDAIVSGQPLFGIDVELPGMLYAVYQKCPVFGGTVKHANVAQLEKLPGVRKVLVVSGNGDFYGLDAGVAIVADSWWQAQKARQQLQVTWHDSKATGQSNAEFDRLAHALKSQTPTQILRNDGDIEHCFAGAAKVLQADYYYPFVAHGQLEPMNCSAQWQDGKLSLWAPTQNPVGGQKQVAQVLGIKEQDITIHVMRSGGGFGRRLFNDYMAEVAWIAREVGAPVKLLWSREDDFQHDFYRPAGYHSCKLALDAEGKLIGLQDHFITFGAQGRPLLAAQMNSDIFPAGFIPNLQYGSSLIPAHIPTGWLRAPGSNALAWVFQSLLDEAAHAIGQDPLAMQLSLLAQPVGDLGSFNPQRMTAVLQTVAERSGWGRKVVTGHGLGIACYYSHAGYFAEVVEVSVNQGKLQIHKVWAVGDVGKYIVNPSGAMHQVQGSILDGLSQALYQQVPIDGGAKLVNYHQHKMLTMAEVPEVDVEFLKTDYPTTGLGEPALPPVIPALCNAVFAATGKRIRRLPITAEMLT
ncbi:molybdopterin cofactor-binding domain-containing protein [Shewanella sp.]|uniref:xanthine dehydrogenase family protein molybdopterin-binding subunit n=1 Tax=Shewanella sp. TaxID=50422 RepID=UPI003D0E1773